MKQLFLAENAEELNNLQSLTEGFAPILNEYLDYLKMNFQVVELPRSIVWAGFETAVNSVSDLPLPAYTNDYRTVMNPQIEVWRRLYLKQTDAYTESESVKKVKQYYEKFNMHNVLQILGHEMAHHSDLFLDETYETEMWFEEGMAEYISRRYFLTDEEYAAEKETNRILSALYDEKFGRPKLNDFSRSTYGRDIVHIFYAYWRSFLAVDAAGSIQLVEVHHNSIADGDAVLCIVAGGVADERDGDFTVGCSGLAGFGGSGLGGGAFSGLGSSGAGLSLRGAACHHAQQHGCRQNQAE